MPYMTEFARELRRSATPPERKLWNAISRFQVGGAKFRRQTPIGRYIADFYCTELKLAIEVDGITHTDPADDAERTAWLNSRGIQVLKFWNNEIMSNIEGVLVVIAEAVCARTPPPAPPAKGGEQ